MRIWTTNADVEAHVETLITVYRTCGKLPVVLRKTINSCLRRARRPGLEMHFWKNLVEREPKLAKLLKD